ncbi:MAG: zinc carboxypeptidase [Acidobacteria bacterium]|nr:zinc carboxypeptidase [Acidobacteriota bacterium]
MSVKPWAVAALTLVLARGLSASFFEVLPAAAFPADTPQVATVLGHDWGEDVSDPEQVAAYARFLAAAAPARVRLIDLGRSQEGRPLLMLAVSAAEHISRLEAIRADLDRLADPRRVPAAEIDILAARVPVVVWIGGSVHGDEPSGGEAALALAHLLAFGDSPEVHEILSGAVVILDPAQNPDGRARFLASLRQARGTRSDPEPASAEHVQPWPGGRFSHDLFDLNRDWFALTHPETEARVRALLAWHPSVAVDLHEMGADQGYFFAPPAEPHHPLITGEQKALWDVFGRAIAGAFDERGWRYWTREQFDSFYPGYGESWPLFNGAVGMTFEQASSRGMVTALKDGGELTYAQTVQHHLVSSFSTCLVAARQRERVVKAWHAFRRAAVADGGKGSTRGWVLEAGDDRDRARALAGLLARQGVEVSEVVTAAGSLQPGSFVIAAAQPLGRLARALLEPHAPMGDEFEGEQERRDAKRLPDQIYDITGWSLPLLWGVPVSPLAAIPAADGMRAVVAGESRPGRVVGAGRVAYLVRWNGPAAVRVLALLHREKVTVEAAGKPFTIGGQRFDRGCLVIRRSANPERLDERLESIARQSGVELVGVDSGYADAGIDLGSTSVKRLTAPRIALAWDTPTRASGAGHLRHALERTYGYPVTVVRTGALAQADLSRFDVVILPDAARGGYTRMLGEDGARRLGPWVRDGGTLIAVGEGAEFLTGEKVGLLASKPEKRGGGDGDAGKGSVEVKEKGKDEPKAETPAGKPFDYDTFVSPSDERPPSVPGAIVRVELDAERILAAGFPSGRVDVLVDSARVLQPLKLDQGVNVGIYAPAADLVRSGFMLKASRAQLPRKAYLMVQGHGRGRVIAFAEDPAARAFTVSSMLLLANAVFLAPAF